MEKVINLKEIFRSFKYRNYRLYFIGQGLSLTGTWMQRMALPWLVYRLTNSPFLLGFIGFITQIPTFILLPFCGVLSDKWNKYAILIITLLMLLNYHQDRHLLLKLLIKMTYRMQLHLIPHL